MLQVQSIACRRGRRVVFRDLGFTLGAGDALLVTGANGSGKSSLLRVLAGLLPPMDGTISWRGLNIADDPDAYNRSLHYIGHLDCVKDTLTVGETLNYWRAIFCLESTASLPQDPFGILALRDRPARTLSAGQKRRLALSRLTLGIAPLWLLDEPTATLDREGQGILSNCIAQHRVGGGIAIIAMHQDMNIPGAMRYEMKGESRR